ncbi:MAG: hypothetical protein U1E64_12695 [Sphingomonadaceae bacterium]
MVRCSSDWDQHREQAETQHRRILTENWSDQDAAPIGIKHMICTQFKQGGHHFKSAERNAWCIQFRKVENHFKKDGFAMCVARIHIGPEQLSLSPALSLALRAWQGHHDEYEPGLTGQCFDWECFNETGRAICELVRLERPDLHVIYSDDE